MVSYLELFRIVLKLQLIRPFLPDELVLGIALIPAIHFEHLQELHWHSIQARY